MDVYVVYESRSQYEACETAIAWRESEAEARDLAGELTAELSTFFTWLELWRAYNPEPEYDRCSGPEYDAWHAWVDAQIAEIRESRRGLRVLAGGCSFTISREDACYLVRRVPRDPEVLA